MNKMYTSVSRKYVVAFLLSLVLSLAGLQSVVAQVTRTFSTPGSYTFTVPAGNYTITTKLWGAGGAGSYSGAGSGGYYPNTGVNDINGDGRGINGGRSDEFPAGAGPAGVGGVRRYRADGSLAGSPVRGVDGDLDT